jgi:hypothetical protein
MRLLCLTALLVLLAACRQPEPASDGATTALRVETDRIVESNPELQYAVNLAFPRIVPQDRDAIARVNGAMRDTARALVADIRPGHGALPPAGNLGQWDVGELEGGFDHFLLTNDLFSALLLAEAFTGGAHGMTLARPLTYDLRTGESITLADLFLPGAPYLEVLAELATERLRGQESFFQREDRPHEPRQREDGPSDSPGQEDVPRGSPQQDAPQQGTPQREGARQDDRPDGDMLVEDTPEGFDGHVPATNEAIWAFALREDGLLLYFPSYTIAPYTFGSAEVIIPYEDLEHILDPNGPVGRLRGTTAPPQVAQRR